MMGGSATGSATSPVSPGVPAARRAPPAGQPEIGEGRELAGTLRSWPVAFLTAGAVLGSAVIAAVAVLFLAYLRHGGYSLAVASAAAGALARG